MSIDDFVKTGRAVLSKAKELERLLAAANGRIRELEEELRLQHAITKDMQHRLRGAESGHERAISDKLEKALKACSSGDGISDSRYKSRYIAKTVLAEVRAIRKGEQG